MAYSTTGMVTVTGLETGTEIELLDMMGRVLAMGTATLDLSGLAPGLYLLRTPNGTAKLLKR